MLGPHKMVNNMAAGSVAAAVTKPPELEASNSHLPSINKLKGIRKLNVIYRLVQLEHFIYLYQICHIRAAREWYHLIGLGKDINRYS